MTAAEPDGLKRVTFDVTVRLVACPTCGGASPLTASMDVSEPWGVLILCQLCDKRIEWGHVVSVVKIDN